MFVVLLSIAADGGPSESYDEFRTFQLSRDKNTDSFVFSIRQYKTSILSLNSSIVLIKV